MPHHALADTLRQLAKTFVESADGLAECLDGDDLEDMVRSSPQVVTFIPSDLTSYRSKM